MSKLRDPVSLRKQLVDWLEERVNQADSRGLVFGLSGGIDSAVVCGLAAGAVGPERCLGAILPIESLPDDRRLALAVAETFGVPTVEVDLGDAYQNLLETLGGVRERVQRMALGAGPANLGTGPAVSENVDALARANLKPRLRMLTLYYFANLLGYLVVGTGNKAELTVGYFTKWGDGAVDLLPLADLVKAEVRALARDLGVPDEVIERPPSAGLWAGQTDEAELGITYEQLDRYVLTGSSGDAEVDTRIRRKNELARHKTSSVPVARPR